MGERSHRWLALASFVVAAVLLVGPHALLTPGEVAGNGIDLPGTLWIHWWVRTTVEHFTLPIWTDLLFYPDGKNFFHDTGANYIDAWLGTPFQWLLGVPDFLDPLNVVIVVGNAISMYALATEVTEGKHPAAAWAASVGFAVNPYVILHVQDGRPTQAMLWFAILATRQILRIRTGTMRDAVWFGVYTALAGLTYWFVVYFLALALLPIALVEFWRSPRLVAGRLAVAIMVAVGICSPFLLGIYQAIGDGEVGRLGFTVFEESPASAPARWRLTADQLKTATCLGALAIGALAFRRTAPWIVGIALATMFAIGGRADFIEPPLTNPLFQLMYEHLPLISRLGFPERAQAMSFILLAMVAAAGLAKMDAVYAFLFAAVALTEPVFRQAIPVAATGFPIPPGNEVIRVEGGPVIHLPFGSNEDAMVYQTHHGQPLFGGMGEREDDLRPEGYNERLKNGFIIMLGGTANDNDVPIAYTAEERAAISAEYRWVWFDRRFNPPSWTAFGYDKDSKYLRLVKELGAPRMEDQEYALWDLRGAVPADAPGLGPDAVRTGGELLRMETATLAPSAPSNGGSPTDRAFSKQNFEKPTK